MIYDAIIENRILIEGQKKRITEEILKYLSSLFPEIQSIILSYQGGALAPILEGIKNVIQRHFSDLDEGLQNQLLELGLAQIDFENDFYEEIVEEKTNIPVVPLVITSAALADSIIKIDVQGVSYQTELKRIETRLFENIKKITKYGLQTNRELTEIFSDIKKSINKTANGFRVFSDTSIQELVNDIVDETMSKNKKQFDGVVYSAVLDNATTHECRNLNGKKFKLKEAPVPPLHHGCRSSLIPIFLNLNSEEKEFIKTMNDKTFFQEVKDSKKYKHETFVEKQKNIIKNYEE